MIVLIICGALAGPALWWGLWKTDAVLVVWLLIVFLAGLIMLRPYYLPARFLLSLTATIFSAILGLIMIFSIFTFQP